MRVAAGYGSDGPAQGAGAVRAGLGAPAGTMERLADGVGRPAVAVGLSVLAIALLLLVGVCAPNAHTLPAPLPWPFPLPRPAPASVPLSTLAMLGCVVVAGVGLAGLLRANSRGWRPSPRLLLTVGGGVVALVACLNPVGSSDTASYAAYGRIAALGGDPYLTTPAALGGAYAHLVSPQWLRTPSVYGPVATWLQAAAAWVGGERPWVTIGLLMLANAGAFLLTGCLLVRISDDPVRAALLWAANPLLIVVLVAGGHLDTYTAALAVAVVHLVRERTGRWAPARHLLAGALVGLAASVKISALLLGAAVLWPPPAGRRGWGRVALAAAGCAGVLAAVYGWYGLHAFGPLSAASHLVSATSPWALVHLAGRYLAGEAGTATAISVGWPVLTLLLAGYVYRRCRPPGGATVTATFALAFAWVLLAPWSMPWYTAMAWALAALLPRMPAVRWLTLATTVLALCHNSGGHGLG